MADRTSWLHIYSASDVVSVGPSVGLGSVEDKDGNVVALYQQLALLRNRVKRALTETQTLAHLDNALQKQKLNQDDVAYMRELLRERFRRHDQDPESHDLDPESHVPDLYEKQDEKGLQTLSEDKLKRVPMSYRVFRNEEPPPTTRKRAFGKYCSNDFALPEPARPLSSETVVSVTLQQRSV
jgi:hypothetical protein